MTSTSHTPAPGADQPQRDRDVVTDWTDLGSSMWSFLTGREAVINYRFIDMSVEVPRDTGADAARATWKLDGTLQITTTDNSPDNASGEAPGQDAGNALPANPSASAG